MNIARKLETVKTRYQRKKQKNINILEDSIIKNYLGIISSRKKVRNKFCFKVFPFSGAKMSCMVDHVKPTICDDKPDHVISLLSL